MTINDKVILILKI